MAQEGRGRLHMTDKEQIVADLIWTHAEKPADHLFTIAHNVYDDHYRVNAFSRVWRGEDGDLAGQVISYTCKATYCPDSHDLKILHQTGDKDAKQFLKDSVKKTGTHTFTAREETTKDGANFSLKK